jgi:hypothetical protein
MSVPHRERVDTQQTSNTPPGSVDVVPTQNCDLRKLVPDPGAFRDLWERKASWAEPLFIFLGRRVTADLGVLGGLASLTVIGARLAPVSVAGTLVVALLVWVVCLASLYKGTAHATNSEGDAHQPAEPGDE